ncbi:hypothetical protein ASD21_12320 [Caulobacter sp. Root1455]|nr:hypothetical protein ASD21_12320 [Caulobacter sp. Root1455]
MWRSREIFVERRHSFLKTATLPLEFNSYKRRSTLYRVAALIGWVRAMSLELDALPRKATPFRAPIATEISAFQKALADGPHVERHRLEQVSAIWKIDLGGLNDEQLNQLASRFEDELHAAVGSDLRADSNTLRALSINDQIALCTRLAMFLCQHAGAQMVDATVIAETVAQTIRGLSYREALLYRDWQDALGDAMLVPDPDSPRRYKIIGYEAFGKLLDDAETPWLKVLSKSIDDIDFDDVDPNDFRALQLKDLSAAAASILIRISETRHEKFLVNGACLGAAQALVKAVKSHKI